MNAEQTDIIPVKKKKKRRHPILKILLVLLVLLIILAAFLYGIIIGGKYGVKINGIDPDEIPVTEYIVNGLKENGKINFTVTLGEDEINEAIAQYEENFAPLKNIYVNPGDGAVVISGQITKEDLKDYLTANTKNEIPDIVWIFVPSTLNLKADVAISVVDRIPEFSINELTILNSDNSRELLSLGGFSNLFQSLIEDIIENAIPENIVLNAVTVTEDGIRVSAEFGILDITE